MKKTRKKLLSILVVLAMVLLMAACGKKDDAKDVDNDVKATPTKAEEKEEVKAEAEETVAPEVVTDKQYPAFDMVGRKIKVGVWWDVFYTSIHKDIAEDPGLSNAETAQMKLDNVRRIEEKYNCTIEFVNFGWDGIKESINTSILAGSPECDIYLSELQFCIPAVVNGLAQDISTFVSPTSDLLNDQLVVRPLEALGGTYLFTEQGLPKNGIYLGYNSTMIEDLGLEDPQELFNKGEWTWDKFAEYALAGTKDSDNDGTVDVYGYGGVFTDFVNGLVMNNGGDIAATETEGLSSKPVTEVLEFMDRIYNIDKTGRPWSADLNDNLLAWSDGKVMFWTAAAWSLKQEADAAVTKGTELSFDYHVVPYPVGPSGDGTITSPVVGNWYFIPVGVTEPGQVLQVFEEYLNWFADETEFRDDPTWIESCFQTEEDVEMAYKCGTNMKLDLWNGRLGGTFDFGAVIWSSVVVNKDATVAQAVEANKQILQDDIDTFYGK